MAKRPELPIDVTKFMGQFDPSKMADDFTKAMKQFKLPGVDVDSLVAAQKKNMEALTNANRVAFEGAQAVAKRQAEILQETMNEASKGLDAISKSGSPPEDPAKQAELAKNAFERALENMREVAVHAQQHELESEIASLSPEALAKAAQQAEMLVEQIINDTEKSIERVELAEARLDSIIAKLESRESAATSY